MRRSAAAVGAVLAAVFLCSCDGPPLANAQMYRLGPGPEEITLLIVGAPDGSAGATVTEQTRTHVRVRAEAPDPHAGESGPDLGREFAVVVSLDEPLGHRAVLNLDGSAVILEPVHVP